MREEWKLPSYLADEKSFCGQRVNFLAVTIPGLRQGSRQIVTRREPSSWRASLKDQASERL